MYFNWFDFIVLCLFTYGSVIGFKRGFIIELGNLISLFVGFFGVFRYYSNLAELISSIFDWPSFINYTISFIIIFFSISYIISMFAKLITKAIKISALTLFNRIFGLIFGILKYLLVLSFFILLINKVFFVESFDINGNQIQSSLSFKPLLFIAEFIIEILQAEDLGANNNWENL